jgi:tetratricopeptide (TPR) repeat protein
MKKLLFILTILFYISIFAQAQQTRLVTISTEPKAIIWINDARLGSTDDKGILKVRANKGIVRVRANGFKETTQTLSPTASSINIPLVKTTDEAELMFLKAEWANDPNKAVEYYEEAIKLRPKYPEALVALARTYNALDDTDSALEAIAKARKIKAIFPEASTVEGRIYKESGDEAKAIASFKRAIKEGNGTQAEAHKELGILYRDRAEGAANEGDFDAETANYQLATGELRIALNQYYGNDSTLYEFLGVSYEKLKKYKEAIGVYEEFLRNFPDSSEATTFRSYITQLKKQMAEQ